MHLAQGTIATSPDDDGHVMVFIDAFDDEQPIGPCPIVPRPDAAPEPGMTCIVALAASASTSLSWVLAYEP